MSEKRISGYKIISLSEMLLQLGEERVKQILSSFCCPQNEDVEQFLKSKAIIFDKQSISKTHLVFTSYKNEIVLIGYFTLANKDFSVPIKSISRTLRDRVKKFGTFDSSLKEYKISAPLIAQLGKNFTNSYNKLITGDELLQMACEMVAEVQMYIGGKIVYIECEDKPKLVEFYTRNGFREFSHRQLDDDDKKIFSGKYLLQLLKYL